nr:MAG TPA_asm: hypothetical protein [Bacteriophage sp.]
MILNKRNLLCFEDYIFGEELLSIITASFKMELPGIQHAGLFCTFAENQKSWKRINTTKNRSESCSHGRRIH